MKISPIALATILLVSVFAVAQEKQQKTESNSLAATLEANVRKVWAEFKNKNKEAVASMLADGFRAADEGGSGFGDEKDELAAMDAFQLDNYELKDFTVKPLGPRSALVTYSAQYQGKYAGEPVQSKTIVGEVWIKQGDEWKVVYYQETNVK